MEIAAAQLEMRTRFVGGFYGQLTSGLLWLTSAGLATWSSPRAAITTLVVGGFFIFPATELLLRLSGTKEPLSAPNELRHLGEVRNDEGWKCFGLARSGTGCSCDMTPSC